MENKQRLIPKNMGYLVPTISSEEKYSHEKTRNSLSIFNNNLANYKNLEGELISAKNVLKANCRKLTKEFEEQILKIFEDRQTGLLVETALQDIEKSFAEERTLFEEVEQAAEDCKKANLNYIAKSKTFLTMNRENKRKLNQFIENLDSEQEMPPPRKLKTV